MLIFLFKFYVKILYYEGFYDIVNIIDKYVNHYTLNLYSYMIFLLKN